MAEQADLFLEDVAEAEALRTDYDLGTIPDYIAYDAGFIDELGVEE